MQIYYIETFLKTDKIYNSKNTHGLGPKLCNELFI